MNFGGAKLDEVYDIFVVGGGINGCGVARDAAGRGFSVCLAEMGDLASGTSSGTSKLIHGGFRYLEYFEIRLVREGLSEREVLLHSAPHIISPLRFVLPHHADMRPAWLLRLGLFLYDHIGARKLLPKTKSLNLKTALVGKPLKSSFSKGFEYSDCWVDDARLVVLNAQDAAERGAVIKTQTKVISAKRTDDLWTILTKDTETGETRECVARLLVNAAGPWVDEFLEQSVGSAHAENVRQVQGSHIVVPKLYDHDRAYLFQNADNRIVFAIPYEQNYTLIGTTDRDYVGDLGNVQISAEEKTYLCDAASTYFEVPVHEEDIVWSYSAVRPLYNDGATSAQEATRDYVVRLDAEPGVAPLLNVFGGKITTYRKLAETLMVRIEAELGKKGGRWTDGATLPGGDFPIFGYEALVDSVCQAHPYLEGATAARLVRAYGTKTWLILQGAQSMADLGAQFGEGLSAREVLYLMEHEWAVCAADVIWRRGKLGIRFTKDMTTALDLWMNDHRKSKSEAAE